MIEKVSNEQSQTSVVSVDHISIAVPSLKEARKFFENTFKCSVSRPLLVQDQGVKIAYVNLGNIKLELMEPIRSDSPITKFLEHNPSGGLHHICLNSDNIEKAAKSLSGSGLNILGGIPLKKGHHGKKLFFMHPRDTFGSLIEIEESRKRKTNK